MVTISELCEVVANVGRPGRDQAGKATAVAGEQGAGRLFETRKITGHRRHEVIGGLARGAFAIRIAARAARRIDQLAQRHRRAAGLGVEPFPVPRQQGHLARDHAELWPPAPARLPRRLWDIVHTAAQLEIDRTAGSVAENRNRCGRAALGLRDREDDLGARTRGQAALTEKNRKDFSHLYKLRMTSSIYTRAISSCKYYPDNKRLMGHRQFSEGLLRDRPFLPGTSDADRPSSQQLTLAAGAVAARRTRLAL